MAKNEKRESYSIEKTGMCIVMRKKSCGAVSGCGEPSTAASSISLWARGALGRTAGKETWEAVRLGESKGFFAGGKLVFWVKL